MQQIFTLLGRASLIHDVLYILLAEISERGDDRVGSRLSQCAEAGYLHVGSQLFDLVELFHCSRALGDVIEHVQETLCADSAG